VEVRVVVENRWSASGLSASRMENPPIAGKPSLPTVATVCKGDPMSMMALPALPAHCIQRSIPAWVASGEPEAICSCADTEPRYNSSYFPIVFLLVL
jgi:hypothetical protein